MKSLILAAAASVATVTVTAQPAYVQLADLDTVNGGDGTTLISGTIVGTTGYAMLSGGGNHRIVKIEDLGGANTVTTLTSTGDLNTAIGGTPTSISGSLLAQGGSLFILENSSDQVLQIDQMTGSATTLVSNTALDTAIGNTGPTLQFGGINPTSGTVYFYEGDTDSVYQVDGTDSVSVAISAAQLTSATGDSTPGGLGVDAAGVIYVGQSTDPENVSFFDPSDSSFGTLITESDVLTAQGSGTDIGISSTAFTTLSDGRVIFANTGSPDNFIAFDPANAAGSLEVVLTEAQLLAGPAGTAAAIAFTEFGGEVAWVNLLNSTNLGAVAGFYAIPEPTTAGLLGLGGLALLRRRRSA